MGMSFLANLLLAGLDLVVDGNPAARLAWEGGPRAEAAARWLNRNVVLMTGVALPTNGGGRTLRFVQNDDPGYTVSLGATGATVSGRRIYAAAYDLLEGWGCVFEGEPFLPERRQLTIEETRWRPGRTLFVADQVPERSHRADGVAIHGLKRYAKLRAPLEAEQRRVGGFDLRVASETFDDFLPVALFDEHPEWFALRGGERTPRGNFDLENAKARGAYLDRLAIWLEQHPEISVAGIWPEVTEVWSEGGARNEAESYALLWREAAERFPDRRFEILATGRTLRPPRGRIPDNVEVRFRPGKDASALQGVLDPDQEPAMAPIVKAWRSRGARLVLEMDASPESWCGLTWPCHDAVRANATEFDAGVLRGADGTLARIWRDPGATVALAPELTALLARARTVSSWGDPRDTAELFFEESQGTGFRIGAVERIYRLAMDTGRARGARRSAAQDALLGYIAILESLPADTARSYARYRSRDFQRLQEELLPHGAERAVGPLKVVEQVHAVTIKTDVLSLRIDRRTAAVTGLRRRIGLNWSEDLGHGKGTFFSVVAVRTGGARRDGRIRLASQAAGVATIALEGRLSSDGPRWSSTLTLRSGSGTIRQEARVQSSGVVAGCSWKTGPLDRWVCPPFIAEGMLGEEQSPRNFPMPPGTLLYCRAGEHGPGLAARLPRGGPLALVTGKAKSLVVSAPGERVIVEWIVFSGAGELGK